jgi:hypothetical protein
MIDKNLFTINKYGYDLTNDLATLGGVDDKRGDVCGLDLLSSSCFESDEVNTALISAVLSLDSPLPSTFPELGLLCTFDPEDLFPKFSPL